MPVERLAVERPLLRPLRERPVVASGERRRVDKCATVRVASARSSVPTHLVGRWVEVQGAGDEVRVHHEGGEVVAGPTPLGRESSDLDGVTCVTADDCWAVGDQDSGTYYVTLIEQHTGTGWSIVSSPNPGTFQDYLVAVSCAGADDCSAVSSYEDSDIGAQYVPDRDEHGVLDGDDGRPDRGSLFSLASEHAAAGHEHRRTGRPVRAMNRIGTSHSPGGNVPS